jgi:RNA polymerase sigma factor (sigma-70 family)
MSRTNTHPQTLHVVTPPTSLGESDYWDMAPDDELICIFIQSNSNVALETLIRRHGPVVARMLGRLLSHPQDREDAFQATFLIFVKSIHRIRKKNSVCSFLIGVALRTGKRLRSQRIANAKLLVAESNLDLLPCLTDDRPLELLAQRLQCEALDEELESLPENVRAPIIEHYYAGLTVPQIAESMQLTVAAVEGRIKRGKRLLRSRLAMRGVSLTAVLGAATQFPNAVSAATIESWSQTLLSIPRSESNPIETNPVTGTESTIHSSVQNLIQGELQMQLTTRSSWLLWTGAVCALSAVGLGMLPWQADGGLSGDRMLIATSDGQSMPEEILLQGVTNAGATATSPQPATQNAAQPVVQQQPPKAPTEKSAPPVIWQRPENLASWMKSPDGVRNDQIRAKLKDQVEVKFNGAGLGSVMTHFATTLDLPIIMDERALEEEGISLDEQITLKLSKEISFRSALKLVLEPLNLTWVIEDEVMRITSKSNSANVLRTYDLSQILPDNSTVLELVSIIERTVAPDAWDAAGGTSTITVFGSLLVVNCPEETHEGIEKSLYLLGNQAQHNIKPAPTSKQQPPGGMGGMGGMF